MPAERVAREMIARAASGVDLPRLRAAMDQAAAREAAAAKSFERAVQRMLTRAGHPRLGKGAGFKLATGTESAEVIWVPETRRRSRDRAGEALAQAEAHAATARAAGWDAVVGEDGGWPVCTVSRPKASSEEG